MNSTENAFKINRYGILHFVYRLLMNKKMSTLAITLQTFIIILDEIAKSENHCKEK